MSRLTTSLATALLLSILSLSAWAGTPTTTDGVTTIHLDQYNGYFTARETLAGLKPGRYKFVIHNKAEKLVGWQIQDGDGKQLDMFPLEPGQTGESVVEIGENGFRYRCPINPTPWYEVGVSG